MKITCTGRKVSLKPDFTQRAEKKLAKLDKFFTPDASAQVTVTVEKSGQTVELMVRDKGLAVRAEKMAPRMEDALDDAVELLERRVIKNRKRLGDRLTKAAVEMPAPAPAEEEEGYEVIREKHFTVKPCTVEEAILQMDLLGHSFYLFRNVDTDEVQVVYRRAQGSYGLLVPER